MSFGKWFGRLFGRSEPAAALQPAESPSRSASGLGDGEHASDSDELPRRFFAAFVDPYGEPIALSDIGDCWPMTIEAVERIKEAPDFIEQLRALDVDYSQSFTFDGEFDVEPLIMIWFPEGESTALAVFNSFSLGSSGIPIEKAPCVVWLTNSHDHIGVGPANIVEGSSEIDAFAEVLARYDQRPLALIVTATPPGSDPLSSAALTFAGAHFLLGVGQRTPTPFQE